MVRQLVGRGPNARDNGPQRYLRLVDLWEAVDPRWLATRRPEPVVQTLCDLSILLHFFSLRLSLPSWVAVGSFLSCL